VNTWQQTATKTGYQPPTPEDHTMSDLRFCVSGCRDLNPGSLVPQLRLGHPDPSRAGGRCSV
jgi:hypothetical protein